MVLALFEHFDRTRASIELAPGRGVEVRSKRGERFELAELREIEPKPTGDRFHRLDLSRAPDTRH